MSSSVILIFCLRTKQPSLDHSSSHLIPSFPTQLNLSKELSIHNPHFVTCHSFSIHANLASVTTRPKKHAVTSRRCFSSFLFFTSRGHSTQVSPAWVLNTFAVLLSSHVPGFPLLLRPSPLIFQVYLSPGSDISLQTWYLHVDFSKNK